MCDLDDVLNDICARFPVVESHAFRARATCAVTSGVVSARDLCDIIDAGVADYPTLMSNIDKVRSLPDLKDVSDSHIRPRVNVLLNGISGVNLSVDQMSATVDILVQLYSLGVESAHRQALVDESVRKRVEQQLAEARKRDEEQERSAKESVFRRSFTARSSARGDYLPPLVEKVAERVGGGLPTSQLAEHVVAEWIRHLGDPDAQVTNYVNDGGADCVSPRIVAQVKHYTGKVPVAEIRSLYGVAAASGKLPMFFTTGHYTTSGRRFATQVGMPLFRYSFSDNSLSECNDEARFVFELGIQALIDEGRPLRYPPGYVFKESCTIMAEWAREHVYGSSSEVSSTSKEPVITRSDTDAGSVVVDPTEGSAVMDSDELVLLHNLRCWLYQHIDEAESGEAMKALRRMSVRLGRVMSLDSVMIECPGETLESLFLGDDRECLRDVLTAVEVLRSLGLGDEGELRELLAESGFEVDTVGGDGTRLRLVPVTEPAAVAPVITGRAPYPDVAYGLLATWLTQTWEPILRPCELHLTRLMAARLGVVLDERETRSEFNSAPVLNHAEDMGEERLGVLLEAIEVFLQYAKPDETELRKLVEECGLSFRGVKPRGKVAYRMSNIPSIPELSVGVREAFVDALLMWIGSAIRGSAYGVDHTALLADICRASGIPVFGRRIADEFEAAELVVRILECIVDADVRCVSSLACAAWLSGRSSDQVLGGRSEEYVVRLLDICVAAGVSPLVLLTSQTLIEEAERARQRRDSVPLLVGEPLAVDVACSALLSWMEEAMRRADQDDSVIFDSLHINAIVGIVAGEVLHLSSFHYKWPELLLEELCERSSVALRIIGAAVGVAVAWGIGDRDELLELLSGLGMALQFPELVAE